jgi:ATP-dependent DNA helicase RecG
VTPQELEAIVAGGEQLQVEFKRTTGQRSDAAKTVCAMLNGAGGFVLFGVSDGGCVDGQDVTSRTLEDVVHELRRIEPHPPVDPEVVPLNNGRAVIALRVPGGGSGPCTYDGRPYIRLGPTTQVMSQAEFRRRLLEEMHPAHRWELQPAVGVTIDDLDSREIIRTVEEAIRRNQLSDPGTRASRDLLRGLGVMRDGCLLNAAVALFVRTECALPYFPQCVVRLARFRGTTTTEFEDNRQFHGNIFELLQVTQTFLRQHLPVAGRIVPSLFERADDPMYPPEALREALVNAFCHREYQAGGGSVSVAILDDRMEIASTGGLHFGLTPEDLRRPHSSRPWNPLIASVLYRRGMIEQWGRGTLKMEELAERAGLARPEFEERTGELVVRFRPSIYVAPRRVERELTSLQRQLLGIVGSSNRGFSLSQIRAQLGAPVPERTIQDTLRSLRDLGLVQSTGWARGARWRLSTT